jgi:hypothetical protein
VCPVVAAQAASKPAQTLAVTGSPSSTGTIVAVSVILVAVGSALTMLGYRRHRAHARIGN